jgi:large subunit ribosomal protein L22
VESKVCAKWIRMSPRKVRRVINEIRGKEVAEARTMLRFMPYTAARTVEKLLFSAVSNLVHADKHAVSQSEADKFKVVEAFCDGGPTQERFQPRARGRAYPIMKRTSHITLKLSDI